MMLDLVRGFSSADVMRPSGGRLPLLSRVAEVFSAPEQVRRLRDAVPAAEVLAVLETD